MKPASKISKLEAEIVIFMMYEIGRDRCALTVCLTHQFQ